MAEYLASIFGTEKDRVNCSFYFKIGACRHGDKCSRMHNVPTFSQTVLLSHLYRKNLIKSRNKRSSDSTNYSDTNDQSDFDDFFEAVFTELEDQYGEVEEMNVCDNMGEHMIGNVYVKFKREEDAERACRSVNNRWFNGEPIYAELSPVTDFREACCRQYEMGECTRGGFCNFMHLKPISYELKRELFNRIHPWLTRGEKWRRKLKKGDRSPFGRKSKICLFSPRYRKFIEKLTLGYIVRQFWQEYIPTSRPYVDSSNGRSFCKNSLKTPLAYQWGEHLA